MPISFNPDTLEAVYTPYKYEHLSFLERGNIDMSHATPAQARKIYASFPQSVTSWPGLLRDLTTLWNQQKEKP